MAKLCNNKLLAASLLEWTLGSKTIFLDAKENTDLIEKAKKLGIELPSPDLAAFETIYCEVDKFNRNGVKLSKKVAEKGLKTLIGKQCNWNHEGANQICGYIIDAEIKENKIYITGILFKSLFKAEFGEVMQLFENGQLYVSFELWNRNEAGEAIIKDLGNGYRELTEMIAHGCALLLIDPKTDKPIPPACPVAQVKKLLASEDVIKEAEQIMNSAKEKNESLVYAELATEEPLCTKCENCTCKSKGGEDTIMDEVILKVEEIAQVTPEPVQVEEPKAEEQKIEAETKPIEEVKPVELEAPKAEEILEPAQVVVEQPAESSRKLIKIANYDGTESVTLFAESGEITSKKRKTITIRYFSDGTEERNESEADAIETYTYSQLEEKVNEAKLEKDIEITNLKTELDSKNQEIENLKVEKAKAEEKPEGTQPELEVGSIKPSEDRYVEIRKEVNDKAFGKK